MAAEGLEGKAPGTLDTGNVVAKVAAAAGMVIALAGIAYEEMAGVATRMTRTTRMPMVAAMAAVALAVGAVAVQTVVQI